jgi:hypothetical protein
VYVLNSLYRTVVYYCTYCYARFLNLIMNTGIRSCSSDRASSSGLSSSSNDNKSISDSTTSSSSIGSTSGIGSAAVVA